MYAIGDIVQIYNHSEPQYNGMYGAVTWKIYVAYNDTQYYLVSLDNGTACECIYDELMEG